MRARARAFFIGFGLSILLVGGWLVARTINARRAAELPITNVHRAITQEEHWLNVARPLQPEDLRGRIILLDFWTFCCINCMHVIPDLHALEHEFGEKLTVIGVHSAKFDNERETANIRDAMLRYEIEHPVVNDADFKIWRTFGVSSWPTLVLISPDGLLKRVYSGEGNLAAIRKDVQELVSRYRGRINTTPLPIDLEKTKLPTSILRFPGKLAYADDLSTLFISDSNHHRILGVELPSGVVKTIIGREDVSGHADGAFDEATFQRPQGILYLNQVLYVADTENHLLREVDLKTEKVRTIAGTGAQGYERDPKDAPAMKTPLSSPWDLAYDEANDAILIAMAGTHQLWSYSRASQTLSVLAGSGRESIDDGIYPMNSLSQPSGIVRLGDRFYFVDSETSSLRVLNGRKIETLIGTGLFDFGFKDGRQGIARLQHPLGVFADDRGVYIADSYNHAIRIYDPNLRTLKTLVGTGSPGFQDGSFMVAKFSEPAGLVRVGEKLYVADTNNHQIRVIDPQTRQVSTLQIQFAEPKKDDKPASFLPRLAKLAPAKLKPGKPKLRIALPEGWKINPTAPSNLSVFDVSSKEKPKKVKAFARKDLEEDRISLPQVTEGHSYLLQGTFYYCQKEKSSVCLIQSIEQELRVLPGGAETLEIPLEVPKR